jgi:tetratricopeptide (TPR) repeat protein
MIGKNEELHKYLLHCSRVGRNPQGEFGEFEVSFLGFLKFNIIMVSALLAWLLFYACLVYAPGFIVRGMLGAYAGLLNGIWLQLIGSVVCFLLAKTKVGLGLVISAFVIFFIVVLTPLIELPLLPFLPFMLSYIASWAYANVVLSRYRKLSRQRVAEIEKESSPTTDNLLEKGVLLLMLSRKPQALEAIKSALTREGGEAFLWNLAGIVLSNMKMYSEAKTAFDKATETSPDDRLLKKIKRNLKLVQKKLR